MTGFAFEAINWSPYLGYEDPDPARLVDAAAAAGFAAISFDEALLAAWTGRGETLAALRRRVEDAGLRPLGIHALAIGDDVAAAVAGVEPLAEAAEALGAPWIQVGGTAPLGSALVEATNAVAARARAAGAALAVEFLPFLPIASIDDTRRWLAAVEAPGAAIVVDTWHFFHGPDDWDALASLRPAEIAYLQFDDHPPLVGEDLLEETTQRRVLPGQGTFDLARFSATLRDVGFEGTVGLEHLSAADRARPVEAVARELVEAARPYWAD